MRKNGYYWVKYHGEWIIGEFFGFAWKHHGITRHYYDEDFDEIDETPITRPQISKITDTSQTLATLKETLSEFPDSLLVTKVHIEMHNKFSIHITEFNIEENVKEK